jgi:hypothetical protein
LRRKAFPDPLILMRLAVALWVFNFCFAMLFLSPHGTIVLFVMVILLRLLIKRWEKRGKRPEACVEEKHRAVARNVRQLRGWIKGGRLKQGKTDGSQESCRPGCGS